MIGVKRESMRMESELEHHTGPYTALFSSAVVVQKWKMGEGLGTRVRKALGT
jgi:hypothetical protein